MSRFVICYQGASDPSVQEERSLVSSFKRAKVIDKMPGTLLVDGPESEIARAVARLGRWTFRPERKLAASPPHKRLR
ncbi:hypothetical protein V8Z80_05035 [Orrella sp. JC864]|uniref:hypothetical protein n=1 Tax=Orrella sp. JC864 TaxID=3120298 RepID=UPI003009924D